MLLPRSWRDHILKGNRRRRRRRRRRVSASETGAWQETHEESEGEEYDEDEDYDDEENGGGDIEERYAYGQYEFRALPTGTTNTTSRTRPVAAGEMAPTIGSSFVYMRTPSAPPAANDAEDDRRRLLQPSPTSFDMNPVGRSSLVVSPATTAATSSSTGKDLESLEVGGGGGGGSGGGEEEEEVVMVVEGHHNSSRHRHHHQ